MFKHGGAMLSPDKFPNILIAIGLVSRCRVIGAAALAFALLAGCNQMVTPRSKQLVKDADARASNGDFMHAVNLYESALDGSADSADIHYKLALLYDDKMSDPLNALHHFKRYLALSPTGSRANEAKNFMKRGELALVTSLSGDSVVTRAEAARLKNENLNLRKQLEEKTAQIRSAGAASEKPVRRAEKPTPTPKKGKSAPRSHTVQSGDTLFSLSRKFYNSPDRWKDILDANSKSIDDPGKLRVGQALTIP
jgi:LysM repeat protein